MQEIEHNPHEKRMTNGIWWAALGLVSFVWATYLYFNDPDWWAISVGAGSAGLLVTWAIEKTGNKIPESWRR